ncbi:MAG: hypothetical protein ACK41O_26770 [Runella zeae]
MCVCVCVCVCLLSLFLQLSFQCDEIALVMWLDNTAAVQLIVTA